MQACKAHPLDPDLQMARNNSNATKRYAD